MRRLLLQRRPRDCQCFYGSDVIEAFESNNERVGNSTKPRLCMDIALDALVLSREISQVYTVFGSAECP